MPTILTDQGLAEALTFLTGRDPDLALIVSKHGPPPMWAREPGFPTLVHIILEQQVSLASARAAFDRLCAAASPLTPERFLMLDDETLKRAGFSRQKTGYARGLAAAIVDRRLDLDALACMDDAAARAGLIEIKGIGRWSADIYLLMALQRPDIWPAGDLALAVAVQRIKHLPDIPAQEELEVLGTTWQPWRAVAARLLWHYYLGERRNGEPRNRQSG